MGNSLDVDVLVVGGGPAGSACALRLARGGARVVLIESGDFSGLRVGEIIDASAREALQKLGIRDGDTGNWAAAGAVSAAWGDPMAARRSSILNPYGKSWRVDRCAFDRMLFARAQSAGALGLQQCRLGGIRREHGLWNVEFKIGESRSRSRARWIVAATGRHRVPPAAPNRARLWLDRLVAVTSMRRPSVDQCTAVNGALIEATQWGWWYSVSLLDGHQLVAFLTDSDLLPSGRQKISNLLQDQLKRSHHIKNTIHADHIENFAGSWRGFDARSGIRRVIISDGWIAVGDAAMAFDPLCGRGVVEALNSGIEAGDWLLQSAIESSEVPEWVGNAAHRFNEFCAQRISVYKAERRWPEAPFWRRRHHHEAEGAIRRRAG